jgi:hypothetical protein
MYTGAPKESRLTHLFIACCGTAWPIFVAPFVLPFLLKL